MSVRSEFERRYIEGNYLVRQLEAQVATLEKQLALLKQQLDDAWVTVKACESRLLTYQQNDLRRR